MLRRGVRFLVAGIAAPLVVAGLAAQSVQLNPPRPDPQQAPTFRTGTTLVPVDVRAFDGKGRPITDLKRDDFTIYEDDVPQEVALFAATALSPVVPDLGIKRRATQPRDDATQPQFAVVRGNMATPPAQFVFGVSGGPTPIAGAPTGPTPTLVTPRSDPVDQQQASWAHPTAANSTVAASQSFGQMGLYAAVSAADVEKIYAAIDQLKHEDGEKHLVYAARTPPTFERSEDVDAIIKAANDARVVIDIAQEGACGCWGVADLERIAKETGGYAGLYKSPEKVQTEIAAANGFQYQLGYYPKDTKLDERYRRIRVKVNRSGLELAYRTGYYAHKPALVMTPDERKRYNRVSAALRSSQPFVGLTVTATAKGEKQDNARSVAVHITVAADGVTMEEDNGAYLGNIDVVVLVSNSRSALVGRSWDQAELHMKAPDYQKFLTAGLTLDRTVPVTSTPSYVKVVIYDPKSDRTGSVMVNVK
jgi:uncharacterized protein (DUF2147 family)